MLFGSGGRQSATISWTSTSYGGYVNHQVLDNFSLRSIVHIVGLIIKYKDLKYGLKGSKDHDLAS